MGEPTESTHCSQGLTQSTSNAQSPSLRRSKPHGTQTGRAAVAPGVLVKIHIPVPALRSTDSVYQGLGLTTCISNKFPVRSMLLAETTRFISHGEDEVSSLLSFYPHHFETSPLSFLRLWSLSVTITCKP